jgi:acetyl-CoA acetyltransferase
MTVLVAGVGIHPFGRFDASYEDLAAVAARQALADAGVGFDEVDATVVSNVREGMAKAQRVSARLGTTGRPVLSTESACASSAAALSIAANLIRVGDADIVLCVGVEKTPRGFIAAAGFDDWQIDTGLGITPIYFGIQAQGLLDSGAADLDDLADISVKNHANGALNPNAMYQKPCSRDEVLASRPVCSPLTLLMLCAPNEGAAAAVLMSDREATRRRFEDAVELRAVSLVSRSVDDWFVPAPSRLADSTDSLTRRAVTAALERSALTIDQIDLIECQDTDAGSELAFYSAAGLCAPGQEGALLRSGDTAMGGRIPVNSSGGLLSKGEPLGASGLGQLHEAVVQLRGQAGTRQVAGAQRALCHVMGAGHIAAATVLAA